MPSITMSFTSAAPPQVLWDLLADPATWPSWTSMKTGKVVTPAPGDDPFGVGMRRAFGTPIRTTTVEDVVAHEAPKHHAYTLVSGLPLKGYRADVTLEPTPAGGTTLTWSSAWSGPAPAFFWTAFMRNVIKGVGGDLVKAADQKAGSAKAA